MIETARSIQSLLALSKLPVFPSVAVRLMQLIAEDTISFGQVADLLKTDASLSTEVLRAANSPLFGTRAEVKSVPLALTTLGLDRVSMLILTTAMWRMVPGGATRRNMRLWWRHNLATALLCKHLAESGLLAEYSYMSGLLHSVGQLALCEAYPAEYLALLAEGTSNGRSLMQAECETFGFDHCELGEALLKQWRLPAELVDCAAYHHNPGQGQSAFAPIVHTACQAASHLGFAVCPGPRKPVSELPLQTQVLLEDEALCVSVLERVDLLEMSLSTN